MLFEEARDRTIQAYRYLGSLDPGARQGDLLMGSAVLTAIVEGIKKELRSIPGKRRGKIP